MTWEPIRRGHGASRWTSSRSPTGGDEAVPADALGGSIRLLWLNSPSNPTGEVLSAERMARIVSWARERGGIVIASDECYALLPWTVEDVPSVLDPRVNGGGALDGVLCVYSLSKQSNLAGYRAAFVAGDPPGGGELTAIRKQAGGMMLPRSDPDGDVHGTGRRRGCRGAARGLSLPP